MAIKERKQITGTEAQIKAYAGHEGVLAYAKDTKHLYVLSGTAGTATELANKADVTSKADKTYVDTQLATKATTAYVNTELGKKADKNYVDASIASVYKYKGSVANQAALPKANQVVGDVYNVEDTGDNFAWDGTKWDKLAGTVDLSAYATKAEMTTELGKKANTSHTHTTAQVTGLDTALGSKLDKTANAVSATKLATPRAIGITGAVAGAGVAFDGTAAINIATTTVDGSKVTGTVPASAKATQDASGNVITTTYATKAELGTKLDKTGTASAATKLAAPRNFSMTGAAVANAVAFDGSGDVTLNVTSVNDGGKIPKSGDAGSITTFETVINATDVSDSSARSMRLGNGGTITVHPGSGDKAWITVVALDGGANINLGANWAWSGSAPSLAKGLVVLAWYGAFGVANFTKWGS